jgi:parallel beta-helix repeat protein
MALHSSRKLIRLLILLSMVSSGSPMVAIAAEPAPISPVIIPAPADVNNFSNVIYVVPGNRTLESGNQAAPFNSITKALNSNPQPGTVIQLAPGTYSTENGEVFPLKLMPGLQLRGSEADKGKQTIIRGGGIFISPTFARQNIAILAANETVIGGITLTNPNPRGYALWLESSKDSVIRNNTFANTTHDGVFLTGSAIATISGNIFSKNRANGISALGSSSGEISDNLFEDTGFGLAIGQQSKVLLTNNRILNNRSGVVISNISTPTLRGNLIANCQEDGVVIIKDRKGQPAPDLGTLTNAGRNVFQNNKGKDINNASGVQLVAIGNQLNRQKIAGEVDLNLPPEPKSATTKPMPTKLAPKIDPTPKIGPQGATPSTKPKTVPQTPNKPSSNPSTKPAGKPPAQSNR